MSRHDDLRKRLSAAMGGTMFLVGKPIDLEAAFQRHCDNPPHGRVLINSGKVKKGDWCCDYTGWRPAQRLIGMEIGLDRLVQRTYRIGRIISNKETL